MSPLAAQIGRFGRDFVVVAVASFVALELFQFVLAQYAMARFWEVWAVKYPILEMLASLAGIGLACGFIVGLGVAITSKRALLLAAWTAFVVFALHFLAATAAGGAQWAITNLMLVAPVSTGLGLLLGALLGRRIHFGDLGRDRA